MLSLFFGVSTFIVFILLDIPYALIMAAIADVLISLLNLDEMQGE